LNAPRSATATALEETELITLSRDDFKQMLREYPQAGMAMLIQLSNRLEKANQEAILLALELALIEHFPPQICCGRNTRRIYRYCRRKF
jgi:CRP-like cAMP-binding protein